MINLFTFCVDIGKWSQKQLTDILKIFIRSLNKKNKYQLHIFTNFNIPIKQDNIIYHEYTDCGKEFNEPWINMNYYRIEKYKYLYDKYNIDFTWIDIDTIICANLDYINDYKCFFINHGGLMPYLNTIFTNNNDYKVMANKYIQGNFWKINIDIYNELMNIYSELKEKKLELRYDIQDLFNYYIHYYLKDSDELKKRNIEILGETVHKNCIYGESLWNKKKNTHASYSSMKRLYTENGKLRSLLHDKNKEIHICSFTFRTIIQLYTNPRFATIFKKFI